MSTSSLIIEIKWTKPNYYLNNTLEIVTQKKYSKCNLIHPLLQLAWHHTTKIIPAIKQFVKENKFLLSSKFWMYVGIRLYGLE